MRYLLAALIVVAPLTASAAEPYRVTPYFECLVGKGVAAKLWDDQGPDAAMKTALAACVSADPGKPPADQDVVDNREYMRVVAYDVIAKAKPLEAGLEDPN